MHLDLLRNTERAVPVVQNPDAVLSLRIWHCKFKTLAPIAAFVRLEHLTIATFPDATLDVLGGLKSLRYLSLVHFPKVTDLSPLAQLKRLEKLSLASLPSWDASGKRIEVQSLDPLAQLPELQAIELLGVVPPDRTLGALAASRTIKTARFSGYAQREINRFYELTGTRNEFIAAGDA